MIDWNFAVQIAAGGFGMVFLLLAILQVLVWAASRFIVHMSKNKSNS
jgi:Na+-transporting methylmalonyl-CoA/oxaloacetate decarboxylase gamma subunit